MQTRRYVALIHVAYEVGPLNINFQRGQSAGCRDFIW